MAPPLLHSRMLQIVAEPVLAENCKVEPVATVAEDGVIVTWPGNTTDDDSTVGSIKSTV